MNDKLLSLLGMARRAGKLETGSIACADAIQRRKARLVFVASDTAARTEKDLRLKCENSDIRVLRLKADKDTLSTAVGKSTGTAAVCDEGFAKRMIQLYEQGGND